MQSFITRYPINVNFSYSFPWALWWWNATEFINEKLNFYVEFLRYILSNYLQAILKWDLMQEFWNVCEIIGTF